MNKPHQKTKLAFSSSISFASKKRQPGTVAGFKYILAGHRSTPRRKWIGRAGISQVSAAAVHYNMQSLENLNHLGIWPSNCVIEIEKKLEKSISSARVDTNAPGEKKQQNKQKPIPKKYGGNEATIKAQLQQHNHFTFVIENANDE